MITKLTPQTIQALQNLPWEEVPHRPGFRRRSVVLSDGSKIEDTEHYCPDCHDLWPEPFIAKQNLWQQYGNENGILCVPCFEIRMGRRLTAEDLQTHPLINALALHIAGSNVALSLSAKRRTGRINMPTLNNPKNRTGLLDQALKRPLTFAEETVEKQWAIDKQLGILDWDPDTQELQEYHRLRNLARAEATQD